MVKKTSEGQKAVDSKEAWEAYVNWCRKRNEDMSISYATKVDNPQLSSSLK